MSKLAIIAALSLAFASSAALAQSPPAATPAAPSAPAAPANPAAASPAQAAAPAATAAKKERTPESLKCSADADAQGLKGDERKKFRRKCMTDARKAAKATAAPVEQKKN